MQLAEARLGFEIGMDAAQFRVLHGAALHPVVAVEEADPRDARLT